MIRQPVPIKLSEEVRSAINNQLSSQTLSSGSMKSADPENFPVFEIPLNKKVLIYVPNHVVTNDDGTEEFLMDKPFIHTVQDGKRFVYYRCISGITATDENGNVIYDGSCPFCDGTSVPWSLANLKIKQKCRQVGLDPEDKDNPTVKAIRTTEFSARVIKEANRYYTFPIVVISTVNDDGKTPVKDESGNLILTPMWYHISKSAYDNKWLHCLEGIEDEPSHPGGRFFTLNFVYDTKGKEPNKRDAAKSLAIIHRNYKNMDSLKRVLDEKTAEWTPVKAQETVITNMLYSSQDLNKIVDDILSAPSDMLHLLEASEAGSVPEGIEATDSGFKLSSPKGIAGSSTGADDASQAIMDETDLDLSM